MALDNLLDAYDGDKQDNPFVPAGQKKAAAPTAPATEFNPFLQKEVTPGQAPAFYPGATRTADTTPYSDVIGKPLYSTLSTPTLDAQRAESQSAWAKWADFGVQVIGKTVTGITEGLGYLPMLLPKAVGNSDGDYSNGLTEASLSANKWMDEHFPIYKRDPSALFDAGDLGSWLTTSQGLISSIASFAVEGAGIAKLMGGLGKIGAMGRTVGSIANEVNGIRRAGLIEEGAAKLFNSATRGRALYELGRNGIHAGTLAWMEGAMSGKRVYDAVYQDRFINLMNETKGDMEYSDKEAKRIARESASTTVQLNTVINTFSNMWGGVGMFFGQTDDIVRKGFGNLVAEAAGKKTGKETAAHIAEAEAGKYLGHSTLHELGHYARQGAAEGIEEMTNQFAERTGIEEGKKGKTYGAVEQLGQLQHYIDRTWDKEGAFNFVLGAIGGVGQHFVTDRANTPLTGEQVVTGYKKNDKGELMKADGTLATSEMDAAPETVRMSPFAARRHHDTALFGKLQEKVNEDFSSMDASQQKITAAVAKGDTMTAEIEKLKMFNLANKNAVVLGYAEALKNTYRDISSVANNDSDWHKMEPQLQQELQQLYQQKYNVAQNGVDTAPIDAEIEKKQEQIAELAQETTAMKLGFAKDATDNLYIDKAKQGVETLDELQKLYDTNEVDTLGLGNFSQYHGEKGKDDEHSYKGAQHIQDFLFIKKANLLLMKKEKENIDKELSQIEVQDRQYEHDNAEKAVDHYLARRDTLINASAKLEADYQKMHNLFVKGEHTEENMNVAREYGALIASPKDVKNSEHAMVKVITARKKSIEKQLEDADNALLNTAQYQKWLEANPNKSYDTYIKELRDNSDTVSHRSRLLERQAELDTFIETHSGFLNELKKSKTLTRLQNNATDYFTHLDNQFKEEQKLNEKANQKSKEQRKVQEHLQTKYRNRQLESNKQELNDIRRELTGVQRWLDGAIHDNRYKNRQRKTETLADFLERKTDQKKMVSDLKLQVSKIMERIVILESAVLTREQEDAKKEVEKEERKAPVAVDPTVVEQSQAAPETGTAVAEPDVAPEPETAITDQPVAAETTDKSEAVKTYEDFLKTQSKNVQAVANVIFTGIADFGGKFSLNALHQKDASISPEVSAQVMTFMRPVLEEMKVLEKEQKEDLKEIQTEVTQANTAVAVLEEKLKTTLPDVEPEPTKTALADAVDGVEVDSMDDDSIVDSLNSIEGVKQEVGFNSGAHKDVEHGFTRMGDIIQHTRTSTIPHLLPNTHKDNYSPYGLKKGSKLTFAIDEAYDGTVNDYAATANTTDVQLPQKKLKTSDLIGPDGKIDMQHVAIVPIKIMNEKGETVQWVHSAEWLGARIGEGPEQAINLQEDEELPVNVDYNIAEVLKLRSMIVEAYNNKITLMDGEVTEKGPGMLSYLPYSMATMDRKANKHIVKTDLAVVDRAGKVKIGKAEDAVSPKHKDAVDKSMAGSVVALVKMANNTFQAVPLQSIPLAKLDDLEPGTEAWEQTLRILEIFNAPETPKNKAEAERIKAHTGYDVRTEAGMRYYIVDQFTHFTDVTKWADKKKSIIDMDKSTKLPVIYFGNDEGFVHAEFDENGNISEKFQQALKRLYRLRYKTVSFEKLNSKKSFNYMKYSEGTWSEATTPTYNDYALRHMLSPITYVRSAASNQLASVKNFQGNIEQIPIYGVNAITKFTVHQPKLALPPTVMKDTEQIGTSPVLPTIAAAEASEEFSGLDFFSTANPATIKAGAPAVSEEALQKLQDAVPLAERNGKSVTQIKTYYDALGIVHPNEGTNPFKKDC